MTLFEPGDVVQFGAAKVWGIVVDRDRGAYRVDLLMWEPEALWVTHRIAYNYLHHFKDEPPDAVIARQVYRALTA
jgi:hypothetical protein